VCRGGEKSRSGRKRAGPNATERRGGRPLRPPRSRTARRLRGSVAAPCEVAAVGEARVRELELERDRFQPASIEVDEEDETEVVLQLWIDRVVVEEVTEVVEDTVPEAVEEVRGVAGDQRGAGLQQRLRSGANMRDRRAVQASRQ
jgi:hypothetical protein